MCCKIVGGGYEYGYCTVGAEGVDVVGVGRGDWMTMVTGTLREVRWETMI